MVYHNRSIRASTKIYLSIGTTVPLLLVSSACVQCIIHLLHPPISSLPVIPPHINICLHHLPPSYTHPSNASVGLGLPVAILNIYMKSPHPLRMQLYGQPCLAKSQAPQ